MTCKARHTRESVWIVQGECEPPQHGRLENFKLLVGFILTTVPGNQGAGHSVLQGASGADGAPGTSGDGWSSCGIPAGGSKCKLRKFCHVRVDVVKVAR